MERLLRTDPKLPTYFAYYCTTEGDILGKLMFTDYEVLFEPLNERLKGYFNYGVGDIRDNTKMGFILGYADIIKEPRLFAHEDP